MPEANNTQMTGIKKRQQIAQANKMIFVWVIIASVAISLCGVTVQFLVRQALFNQKVISAKLETQGTLSDNLENVKILKQNVDALLADEKLSQVKANEGDTNLKVVLDALPTEDDQSALGASLQQVILPISKVDVTDLTTVTQAALATTPTTGVVVENTGLQTATFTLTASGDYNRVQSMFKDFERTIRPMNIQALTLQNNDGLIRTSVAGVTYYYPAQTVQLGKKTIKP